MVVATPMETFTQAKQQEFGLWEKFKSKTDEYLERAIPNSCQLVTNDYDACLYALLDHAKSLPKKGQQEKTIAQNFDFGLILNRAIL